MGGNAVIKLNSGCMNGSKFLKSVRRGPPTIVAGTWLGSKNVGKGFSPAANALIVLVRAWTSNWVARVPSTGLEEQIRYRAYQLYEQRGNADGYELEDWLQAEAEILGSKREPVAA